jgi:O-antigen/teichoic acid export membrane protein
VTGRTSGRGLVRSFGSALLIQATLSAGNFLVSWLLLRRTSDTQYGYYVLVFNGLLLATALQGSFVQAQMVVRLIRLDAAGRADLVAGLLREQGQLLRLASWVTIVVVALLRLTGLLNNDHSLLIVCTTLAAAATLVREYLRMVLFAYRRPEDVLWADVAYVALLLAGVVLATYAPTAAAFAVLATAAAAGVSSMLLTRAVSGQETGQRPRAAAQGILRTFAPLGAWSVAGAAAHWALSQGYTYIVAGVLSVPSIAAIAGTRLLLMPLNLLSAGIGAQLFPMTADWVHRLGVLPALRRLTLVSIGFVVSALCYFAVIWYLRDWIFTSLLHRQFAQQDALLLLWCGAFVLMLVRDQLVKLLAARERFQLLTSITVASALLSLAFGYLAMRRFGELGAVTGIVIGELVNVIGIVILSFLEVKRTVPAAAPRHA